MMTSMTSKPRRTQQEQEKPLPKQEENNQTRTTSMATMTVFTPMMTKMIM